MSDIVKVRDETINISESVRAVMNSGTYGVAGTSPLADYDKRINVLLCDAFIARWATTITEPMQSDINFLTSWYTGSKDIELIFRQNAVDRNTSMRSTDWRLQGVRTFVDLHIFVRGAGGDAEPDTMRAVENAVERVIETNHDRLIPHASCACTSIVPASDELIDDLQTLWHSIMTVEVVYWKARTT